MMLLVVFFGSRRELFSSTSAVSELTKVEPLRSSHDEDMYLRNRKEEEEEEEDEEEASRS